MTEVMTDRGTARTRSRPDLPVSRTARLIQIEETKQRLSDDTVAV